MAKPNHPHACFHLLYVHRSHTLLLISILCQEDRGKTTGARPTGALMVLRAPLAPLVTLGLCSSQHPCPSRFPSFVRDSLHLSYRFSAPVPTLFPLPQCAPRKTSLTLLPTFPRLLVVHPFSISKFCERDFESDSWRKKIQTRV